MYVCIYICMYIYTLTSFDLHACLDMYNGYIHI